MDISFGPLIVAVATEAVKTLDNASLLNVTIALNYSRGLHHADVPECAGCCRGATGPLIQVRDPFLCAHTPAPDDSWPFT